MIDLGTDTLTLPDGTEVDVKLGIGLSITAIRPPASPPPPPPAPPSVPVPAGYWKFDGNPNDSSGNGRNLSTGFSSYPAGKFGQCGAGAFDRTSQDVLSGAVASVDCTVSLWVKLITNGSFNLNIRTPDFLTNALNISVGQSIAAVSTDNMGVQIFSEIFNTPIPDNVWTHFALVLDSGTARLYMDGVLLNTADVSGVSSVFGTGQDFAVFVSDVAADDFAVFGAALSGAQVAGIAAGTHTVAQLMV